MSSSATGRSEPPPAANLPRWYTVEDAAARSGLAVRTVREAITRRELVPDGRGRAPLFRIETIDAWLEWRAQRARGEASCRRPSGGSC